MIGKWSSYYYRDVGYAILFFGFVIVISFLFYSFGWWDNYIYSAPLVYTFWLSLFMTVSFIGLGMFALYSSIIEKDRDHLFISSLGIKRDKVYIFKLLIEGTLDQTLSNLDRSTIRNDNIKVKMYIFGNCNMGWVLKDSKVTVCVFGKSRFFHIIIFPNYSKNATKIKSEIYKNLKEAINRFMQEQI